MDAAQIAAAARRRLGPRGIHVDRFMQGLATRAVHIARQADVSVVIDVGAADGGFATRLRRSGWRGPIESFEPRTDAYESLKSNSTKDPLWTAHQVALGDAPGVLSINVAANGVSSSFRQTSQAHLAAAPASRLIAVERVPVARLDDLNLVDFSDRAFIKLDVQGTEEAVLRGAARVLDRTVMMQVELSLVELYRGQLLYMDMLSLLREEGFEPWWFERGTRDPASGRLLQMDGVFVRHGVVAS